MSERKQQYAVSIDRDTQGEPQRLLYAAVASQPGSKVTLMTTDSDVTSNAAAYADGTLTLAPAGPVPPHRMFLEQFNADVRGCASCRIAQMEMDEIDANCVGWCDEHSAQFNAWADARRGPASATERG